MINVRKLQNILSIISFMIGISCLGAELLLKAYTPGLLVLTVLLIPCGAICALIQRHTDTYNHIGAKNNKYLRID